jgi:aminoglycoside phosphotransferase
MYLDDTEKKRYALLLGVQPEKVRTKLLAALQEIHNQPPRDCSYTEKQRALEKMGVPIEKQLS